eukprot:c10403_g1_i1.p1 GENE.c10403_g1_i1~~c10403_g1_i1.p1  ORF type:complete len:405 (+),score=86.80 c10403_g1_i1:164-1378(+)
MLRTEDSGDFWIPKPGTQTTRPAIYYDDCPQGEGELNWEGRAWRFRHHVGAKGVKIRAVELGEDTDKSRPIALLYHGFPEGWVIWVDIAMALDEIGFHVVMPELRGYGGSDAPSDYSAAAMSDDFHAVINSFGVDENRKCLLIAHDLGAVVAHRLILNEAHCLLGSVILSVPIAPTPPESLITTLKKVYTKRGLFHYLIYHQEPGVAESEYSANCLELLRRTLTEGGTIRPSSRYSSPSKYPFVGAKISAGGVMNLIRPVHTLPPYRSVAMINYFAKQYEQTGFVGPLGIYRSIHEHWEATVRENEAGRQTTVTAFPVFYLAGRNDIVIGVHPDVLFLRKWFPCFAEHMIVSALRKNFFAVCKHPDSTFAILPGIGHWVEDGGVDFVRHISQFARKLLAGKTQS